MGKLNHLTQILYSPYDVIESLNPIQFDLMSSGYEGQSPQSPPLSRYRWVSLFKSCSEQYISDTIVTLLCAHQTPGNIYLFIWEYGISSLIFLWQCTHRNILLSLVNRRIVLHPNNVSIVSSSGNNCHHAQISSEWKRRYQITLYTYLFQVIASLPDVCSWLLCPWDCVLCAVIFYQLVLRGRLARLSLACHKINQTRALSPHTENPWIVKNVVLGSVSNTSRAIEFSLLISIVFDQTASVGSGELEGIVLDKHRETSGEPSSVLE